MQAAGKTAKRREAPPAKEKQKEKPKDLKWAQAKQVEEHVEDDPSSDVPQQDDEDEEDSEEYSEAEIGSISAESEEVDDQSSDEESSDGTKPLSKESSIGPSNIPLEDYSDSSGDEQENRVGKVPMKWYSEHDHIGYNVEGEKVARKLAKKDELDKFVNAAEKKWTVYDPVNDREIELSARDREIIRNIQKGRFPDPEFDPDFVYGGLGEPLQTPLTDMPVPKRRFIPSKHEKQRINFLAMLIKRGWIKPPAQEAKERKKAAKAARFRNIWDASAPATEQDQWLAGTSSEGKKPTFEYVPPPKLKLPGHAESYNPPEEFLFTPEEVKQWQEADPADRKVSALPQKHAAMRHVPAYPAAVRERFERCLDIYLCPRKLVRRQWVDDLEQLLPKLPHPRELRPFPTTQQLVYNGHSSRVRSITIDPRGQWLASASDDRTVIVWEIATTRVYKRFTLDELPMCVAWCPNPETNVLAVAAGSRVLLLKPGTSSAATEAELEKNVLALKRSEVERESAWQRTSAEETAAGIVLQIRHPKPVQSIAWHHRGDYFAAVCPGTGKTQVRIHQLSKQYSQYPFSKGKGRVEAVQFHPSKPELFVATQRYLRVYNLQKQILVKKMLAGVKHVSSMAVHGGGDHVLLGSFDRRTCWMDMDLGDKPLRTMRYHRGAVRAVAFHPSLPLFASSADDGTAHVFHATVYADLSQNPLVVPVKVLRGHDVVDELGVIDCRFHPKQPWLFTAGADHTIRLFV